MPEMLMREAEWPDFSQIITEDDEPVDNMFSEKQQRLLTEPLHSCWNPGRPFVAAADVAIFYDPDEPPVVPDTFVSLDVRLPDDIWATRNRSYFLSVFGKPPEVAVEIVSNTKGGETGKKITEYARIGVGYYIIFDPQRLVQKNRLRIHELSGGGYIPKLDRALPRAGLGAILWEGTFEGREECWLRWVDHEGNLIPTGREWGEVKQRQSLAERKRAREADRRALAERKRAREADKWAREADKRAREADRRADDAEQRLLRTARGMLAKGYGLSEVGELTGLSADELATLNRGGQDNA